MKNRDEFPQAIKDKLCRRVGGRCSNPECRINTIGPASDDSKIVSVGQAALICAAAPGGPRYDAQQTPAQRSSINNGIWLCNNCARKIDREPDNYPVALLHKWKIDAENAQRKSVGKKLPDLDYSQEGIRLFYNGLSELHNIVKDLNTYVQFNFFRFDDPDVIEGYIDDRDDLINKMESYDVTLKSAYAKVNEIFKQHCTDLNVNIAQLFREYIELLEFKYSTSLIYTNYYGSLAFNIKVNYKEMNNKYLSLEMQIFDKISMV